MAVPEWVVREAAPHEDYTIELVFADGQHRVFDAAPLLEESFYKPLRQLPRFLSARVECGTVVWDDVLDIAPETLYERSRVA